MWWLLGQPPAAPLSLRSTNLEMLQAVLRPSPEHVLKKYQPVAVGCNGFDCSVMSFSDVQALKPMGLGTRCPWSRQYMP